MTSFRTAYLVVGVEPMKAAFLIEAHNQPQYVSNLVKSLRCDWATIFIHIDRKSRLDDFTKLIQPGANVIFLEKNQRVSVHWGGFSQVRAILKLIASAMNHDVTFDRYCLISGSDFPIKHLDAIRNEFESNTEFIRVDRKISGQDNNSHCKNVSYYYFMDYPVIKNRLSGKIRRNVYDKINLYHGSSWWALTKECMNYISEFVASHDDYSRFHRYTMYPDEIFFHSIIKSSPFKGNIKHDFERETDLRTYFSLNEHGCHYIDWNTPGVSVPKVMTASDVDNLINSRALFARKFQEGESDTVLQLIEKHLESTGKFSL